MEMFPEGVLLEPETYNALISTLRRDCRVLESFRIMDYSLLVGIHNLDQAAREDQVCERCLICVFETKLCTYVGEGHESVAAQLDTEGDDEADVDAVEEEAADALDSDGGHPGAVGPH